MSDITLPSAAFFDMDGTLLDWQVGMEESWLAACAEHCDGSYEPAALHAAIVARRTWFWSDPERQYAGRMNLDEASRTIVRHAFADMGLAGGTPDNDALPPRIGDSYRARRLELMTVYDGAIETLDWLRSRGVPLALLTNGGAKSQRHSVERFGFSAYFDCIVIEGEFGTGKPDERVFRHALEATGADPATTWMIGDNFEADIVTPHRLGMHTVWIDENGAGVPAEAPCAPHRVIRHIRELLAR